MAEKDSSTSTIDNRGPAVMSPLSLPGLHAVLRMLLLSVVVTAFLPNSKAESLASKNKEGNRLFAQGKYEDAEKAYLEAQGKIPGKPEILYNLGNSLIKQNKYDQGIQSLRQSMSKGDKGIKERSWYNAGNALFLAGKFKDSAEAYVQALKLDPSDGDAKHNLELALMKLKQQNSGAAKPKPSGEKKEGAQQTNDKNQNSSGGKDQNESTGQQADKAVQREGSISREQALQILDAFKNRELEDQRKLLERRTQQRANEKDW
jgi:Ca-activated chloride channel homolog